MAYWDLSPKASPGVDGVTWEDYGQDLVANLRDLHDRVHSGRYQARPSRRAYIPKADGRLRPLGITALEDKILQRAVAEVLNAVYETDFLGFSYGFRPGRSPHHALDALTAGIYKKKVNWVLDADIRDFFTSLDQGWLGKFLGHRIADKRVLRLVGKWLGAGVIENGTWSETPEGSRKGHRCPDGEFILPLLQPCVGMFRVGVVGGGQAVLADLLTGMSMAAGADIFTRGLSGGGSWCAGPWG